MSEMTDEPGRGGKMKPREFDGERIRSIKKTREESGGE